MLVFASVAWFFLLLTPLKVVFGTSGAVSRSVHRAEFFLYYSQYFRRLGHSFPTYLE
jgi:hypothetical protein